VKVGRAQPEGPWLSMVSVRSGVTLNWAQLEVAWLSMAPQFGGAWLSVMWRQWLAWAPLVTSWVKVDRSQPDGVWLSLWWAPVRTPWVKLGGQAWVRLPWARSVWPPRGWSLVSRPSG
jgi:hypothetical protein